MKVILQCKNRQEFEVEVEGAADLGAIIIGDAAGKPTRVFHYFSSGYGKLYFVETDFAIFDPEWLNRQAIVE